MQFRRRKGNLVGIMFNPVASTVTKMSDVQTAEVNVKLTSVNVGPCSGVC
jgi:hypothetical protein